MTHYQPPQIGFNEIDRARLDALGWPNHLIDASSGEIALAYQAHCDRLEAGPDFRQAVAVMIICAVFFGIWAWGVFA